MRKKNKWFYILLMAILILISGSPVLNIPILYGLLGLGALYYSLTRTNIKKRTKLWKYLFFLTIIFIAQYFTLSTISILGSLNVMLKIIFGATVMWVFKERFRYQYLDVMYFFALVSLVLFSLGLIGVVIPNIFPTNEIRHSILIYNTLIVNLGRNCGPFWEPGAFACYLILIPLLFIDNLKILLHSYKKQSIVLFIALITTFSTTGYICLAVIMLFYVLNNTRHKVLSYLFILPVAILGLIYAYTSLDFLGEKISEQFGDSQIQYGEFSNTRFGSLMFDLHYMEKHPLVGNGLTEVTRYADHPYLWGKNLGHGNGFSNYTVQMGVVAMLLYLFLLFKNLCKSYFAKWVVVVVIILLLQGEQLLNYPLFLSLPFIINKINENVNNQIYSYEKKYCSNFNRL